MKLPRTPQDIQNLTPAQIEELQTWAARVSRFTCKDDPEDPNCCLIEIRRLDVGEGTRRHNTGADAGLVTVYFCLAYLEGVGVLPTAIVEQIIAQLPPKPPSEGKEPSRILLVPG